MERHGSVQVYRCTPGTMGVLLEHAGTTSSDATCVEIAHEALSACGDAADIYQIDFPSMPDDLMSDWTVLERWLSQFNGRLMMEELWESEVDWEDDDLPCNPPRN